jgi:hypothetical protein
MNSAAPEISGLTRYLPPLGQRLRDGAQSGMFEFAAHRHAPRQAARESSPS